MEWSKIKNIIILILALVNVFLLVLVGVREWRGGRAEEEARQGAVAALEQSGISFLPEHLPDEMSLTALNLTRDRSGEAAAAEALLGAAQERADTSTVRTVYEGTHGWAEFAMNGAFSIKLEDGAYPLQDRSSAQESQRCLELLGFTGELVRQSETGGQIVLIYRQSWDGAPVFSCQAEVVWQNGCLRSIQGQRITGTTAPAELVQTPLTTATALVRFLAGLNQEGYLCGSIQSMTAGYRLSGPARPTQLTPAWYILTDTGGYYLDAVTGALSLAQESSQ